MSLGYIGSKKSLISFIEESLKKHINIDKNIIFADLFAGTGFVGNFFNKKYNCKIIANDLEYYSYVINYSKLNCLYSDKLSDIIDNINDRKYDIQYQTLIKNTYSPFETCERMYFTIDNADFIDYCSCVISYLYNAKLINKSEMIFLKGSLVTSLDKIANTSSVYGAYLKKFKKSATKKLTIVPIHTLRTFENRNKIYNDDILNLKIKADVCYLDPPYNARQYGSNYSQLNYILKYDKNIEIKGKTGVVKEWNRSSFSSKKTIVESMKNIISNIDAKILMLSYNNEGLLTKEKLTELLNDKYSKVTLYEQQYKKFKAKSKINGSSVVEYLFVCE
jgi:adenine-specific DNA-methyltransferase